MSTSAFASAIGITPTENREVVRCDSCNLVQYRTTNPLCRRCHKSLEEKEVPKKKEAPIVQVPVLEVAPEILPTIVVAAGIPQVLKQRRLMLGLSRTQISGPGFAKSYISKLEKGTIPNFPGFQRYARKLGTRGSSLLAMIENPKTELLEPLSCSDEAVLKYTGPVLRRLRDESGKSKSEFLSSAGVAASLLWRWETGKAIPNLLLLERFATGIDKPISWVVAEIENAACLNK